MILARSAISNAKPPTVQSVLENQNRTGQGGMTTKPQYIAKDDPEKIVLANIAEFGWQYSPSGLAVRAFPALARTRRVKGATPTRLSKSRRLRPRFRCHFRVARCATLRPMARA